MSKPYDERQHWIEACERARLQQPNLAAASHAGITILALNEYQRTNLKRLLDYALSVNDLNTGDWVGELRFMVGGDESPDSSWLPIPAGTMRVEGGGT